MRDPKQKDVPVGLDQELNLQSIMTDGKQKYLLVNLLARRSRELNEGARALVRLDPSRPQTTIELALSEARTGALKVGLKEVEQVVVDLVDNNN